MVLEYTALKSINYIYSGTLDCEHNLFLKSKATFPVRNNLNSDNLFTTHKYLYNIYIKIQNIKFKYIKEKNNLHFTSENNRGWCEGDECRIV